MKIQHALMILLSSAILFFPSQIFGEYLDKLPWSEERPLTWADFQGVPGTLTEKYEGRKDVEAFTRWWLEATWTVDKTNSIICEYEFTDVNAVASLVKNESWVNDEQKTNDYLLKHEQGHLDIVEIHAKKFESELLNKKFPCPNGVYDSHKIYENTNDFLNQILEETRVMNDFYDIDTNHASNTTKQSEWNDKILFLLKNPDQEFLTMEELKIPNWIRNNAKWWSEDQIGDSDFVSGIQYMIKENIMVIPDLPDQASETAEEAVPYWVRNNAGWWADGLISDDDFISGIKYLVEQGIIRV